MKTLHIKHNTPLRLVAMACALLVASCSSIHHTKGLVELALDNPVEGVQSLEIAAKRSPTDAAYQIDYLQQRDQSVREALKEADALRLEGKLPQATELYERILKMDPTHARATSAMATLRQDHRNEKLIDDGEAFLASGKLELALDRAKQVLQDNPKSKRALLLRDATQDAKIQADLDLEKLRLSRSVMDKLVTLQYSEAPIKAVFETLSRSTGVNVLVDKDVKQDSRVTIFVRDVTLSNAIDLVLMQNQLQKRVVNSNTLMIYPATPAKSAEYEDLVIRTFQITNTDIKYLSNMLKAMLKLKDVSADEKTGILVIRDTPATLRMAERLIAAHDVPDPEIMLEVTVLEVSTARDSNLGIVPPTGITFSTPAATGSSLTLGALTALTRDELNVTPLSTTLNFKLSDSDAKILASPRIRARNKETARIMIGDRVPTITNSVTPVTTGPAVVTGTVTYQDVGLKLEFEPQVYANSEVGIKISLEVSNIAQQFTDSNGGRSYQIGTRNATTNLRLKDGETQVLGGLINDEDRNTAAKIPGLGHLPVIGRLFGNNSGTSNKSEIILAITPRIVRNLAVRSPDVKSIFSGTLNSLRENPILADPVTELKTTGVMNPGSTGQAPGAPGPVLFNATPAKTQAPSSVQPPPRPTPSALPTSAQPLAPPPPMVTR